MRPRYFKKLHATEGQWVQGFDVPLRFVVTAFGFWSRCLRIVRGATGVARRRPHEDLAVREQRREVGREE